jgi:hypothetical protein
MAQSTFDAQSDMVPDLEGGGRGWGGGIDHAQYILRLREQEVVDQDAAG